MPHSLNALKKIKAEIQKVQKECATTNKPVELLAVSKNFLPSEIQPLLEAGHRHFGENRVQEAQKKWPSLRKKFPDICLHLIGALQSNKAQEAVQLFDVIQTVDREKIAIALAKEMERQKRFLPCYIQVNTGAEQQKSGISPLGTKDFVAFCQNLGLNIVGLMCIPPARENAGPHFALLRQLAGQCAVEQLSMGMSDDFKIAIAFGATQIRLGSALFGPRS